MEIRTSFSSEKAHGLLNIIENIKDFPEYCIAEGERACEPFIHSNYYHFIAWVITDTIFDRRLAMIDVRKVIVLKDNDMKKYSQLTTPPGFLCLCKKKPIPKGYLLKPTFVLYELSDPGNVGTIIRTAVALKRKDLFLVNGCNYHNSKVVQATAGMLAHINVIRGSWEYFLELRDKQHCPVYAFDANGEDMFNFPDDMLECGYIMIGNEAKGIPENVLKDVDKTLSLPMSEECESLNAAIAASIAGYKAWKVKK